MVYCVRTVDKSTKPFHLRMIEEYFLQKKRMNSRYSLRAYSNYLNIDSSLLSKTLKGKRDLSLPALQNVLLKLNLNSDERDLFWKSANAKKLHKLHQYESKNEALTKTVQAPSVLIEAEIFQAIAEPYHYQITELATLPGFKFTIPHIAKRIGISRGETATALNRLVRLGLLEKDTDGYKRKPGRIQSENFQITSRAHREHQRRVLAMASQVLDEVPLEKRHQQSMTISVSAKKVDSAKLMIQEFVEKLTNHLESDTKDEIYQMSFSLFPVATGNQKTEVKP
jgi:uncharacterized protein (TIGR02147 family)